MSNHTLSNCSSVTYSDIFAPAWIRRQSSAAFDRHPASPQVGLNWRLVVAVKHEVVEIYTVFGVVARLGNVTCLRYGQASSALVADSPGVASGADSPPEPVGRKREVRPTEQHNNYAATTAQQSWKTTFPASFI